MDKVQEASDRGVALSRVIDAPRERVWKAWSDPKELARWFAPKPYALHVEKMDFRPGGSFQMAMRNPAGQEHPFTGVYREVEAPARLVWVGEFPYGPKEQIRTEVDFEALNEKTKVRVRQTFSVLTPETEPHARGAKMGWTFTLNQLEALCGGQPRKSLKARRRFAAPAERVYDAWLDPARARKWLFATPGGKIVRCDIDARPGGSFVITDRRQGEDVEHAGSYLNMDRPRRLVFSFSVPKFSAEETLVSIEILSAGKGCALTLTHEGVLPEWAGRTREGWSKLLKSLAAAL